MNLRGNSAIIFKIRCRFRAWLLKIFLQSSQLWWIKTQVLWKIEDPSYCGLWLIHQNLVKSNLMISDLNLYSLSSERKNATAEFRYVQLRKQGISSVFVYSDPIICVAADLELENFCRHYLLVRLKINFFSCVPYFMVHTRSN